MSPEAQRIAIAEACGWVEVYRNPFASPPEPRSWTRNGEVVFHLPDYLSDLNAMHEAVMSRKDEPGFMGRYNVQLAVACVVSGRDVRTKAEDFAIHNADAAHRAEAFLRTLNLWDDSK